MDLKFGSIESLCVDITIRAEIGAIKIKNTGRLVPQRSIVRPMRSAVLDNCIDELLLVSNNVKAVLVMGVKLTQGVNWHLNG